MYIREIFSKKYWKMQNNIRLRMPMTLIGLKTLVFTGNMKKNILLFKSQM